jgi:hypothetical protein
LRPVSRSREIGQVDQSTGNAEPGRISSVDQPAIRPAQHVTEEASARVRRHDPVPHLVRDDDRVAPACVSQSTRRKPPLDERFDTGGQRSSFASASETSEISSNTSPSLVQECPETVDDHVASRWISTSAVRIRRFDRAPRRWALIGVRNPQRELRVDVSSSEGDDDDRSPQSSHAAARCCAALLPLRALPASTTSATTLHPDSPAGDSIHLARGAATCVLRRPGVSAQGDATQLEHGMTDCREHAAYLALPTFCDGDLEDAGSRPTSATTTCAGAVIPSSSPACLEDRDG